MKSILRLFILLLGWAALGPPPAAWAQVCANPGNDGSTFSAMPNSYYPGTGTATKGTKTITVGTIRSGGSTTPIGANDLLLVIQMQGADINSSNSDSYGDGVAGGGANGNLGTNFTAGQYEYVVAASVSGSTITTTSNLANTYTTSAVGATATLRTFQVVRVPQYSTLTLTGTVTAPAWNGATGGIVAMDVAGTMNFNGNTIDVSGLGFRGGAGRILTTNNANDASYATTAASNLNAQKGEGTAGTPQYVNNGGTLLNTTVDGYPGGSAARGGPGNAGGGGNDNLFNSGGAGGANGGNGGRGGNTYKNNVAIGGEPGAAFAVPASNNSLVLGGGGGAGSTNEGTGTPGSGFASSGAAGGGIVLVRTGLISNSGTILANAAATNNTVLNDGSAGGGAGGSILITAATPAGLSGLTLTANGSNGGSNRPATNGGTVHGPGGGGGGGVILTNGAVASATATGGASGICTYSTVDGNSGSATATSTDGAAAGSNGVVNTNISNTIANSTAGANCIADLSSTITATSFVNQGQSVTAQVTFSNAGPLATSASGTVTLPAGATVTSAPGGTIVVSGGITTVTYSISSLSSGGSSPFTLVYTAATAGTITINSNIATTGTTEGGLTANNTASASTTVSTVGAVGTPAPCATAGKDGAAAPLTTNPNAYYPSTAAQTLAVNATTISVGAARGAATSIAPGDLLLVIQMQGADITSTNNDSYGDGVAGGAANGSSTTTNFRAGTYEYVTVAAGSATVTAAAGGTITLATGLKNSYANAVATTTTGQRTFQVIRVPQYTNVTLGANIVPSAWNGATGGIVAIDVDGQLNLAGYTIDASGMGFRGGAGRQLGGDKSNPLTTTGTDYRSSAGLNTGGTKGEGIVGTPRYVNDPAYATANSALLDTRAAITGYPTLLPAALADGYPSGDNGRGAPGNAGGGGTDSNPSANNQNTGGGGGANGGTAGRGGNAWSSGSAVGGEPGAAFPAVSSSRLVLGGGGGAGATNDGTGTPANGFASSGAAGGGVVLVRTGTLTGTGNILANGANANNSVVNDGSGGGGAGGSILVTVTNSQSATLTLTANGGTGGTNTGGGVAHGPGGGGGGGVILTNSTVAATATANGGANGTTYPDNTTAFGSTPGTTGVTNAVISNSIANSAAGANCIADVATTITGPANANAGSTVALSVTYSNIGALPATGVVRTVSLPAGVLNPAATGATITGNVVAGYTVTYPATSLNSGDTNTYAITYTAPASGTVVATSNTSTNTSEGGLTANNTSSVSTAIGLIADVTTTLAGPTALNPGQPSGTYTATFTNNGPSTGATVTQQVTLPAGVTNVVIPNTATYNTTTRVIDFGTANTLASGATNSFNFSFTAPTTPGSLALASNVTTATSQGNDVAPNSATLSATIANFADVVATITPGAGTVTAGQTGTFNVTFINNGPATATGVTASVQLPAGLTGVTVNNGGTYDINTGLVSYPGIGGVVTGTGNRVDTRITFTAPASGPVTGTASISTTTNEGGQTANNTQNASIAITPAYDVATTISGPATTAVGVQTTFSVVTTNNGPSVAPSVVQTVQLPTGLTNVYVSNGGTYNSASGVVTFPTLATLANGAKVDNTISFTPVAATNFTASATVVANANNSGDSNTANNTASAPATTVNAAPVAATNANIYTSITSPSANVAPGATTTFTVTSGNRGAATANTVAQQTTLPAGLSNVVVKDANGNTVANSTTTGYNSATGVVIVPAVASLASGSTTSYTISLTAPASGLVAAVATISSNNADAMPSDNIATADVTVNPTTDLAIALTGPTSALAGQSLTYTATTTNYGSVTATNVVQTVAIPAGLTGVTVSGGGTYNSTTGVVTFPAIVSQAVGNAVSNTITYTAPANGPLVNVASVASATVETNTANNGSTVTTAVQNSPDVVVYLNGPATQVAGNTATYTVTTTNNGPSPAASETTTVQLATGLANVVVRDASGNAIANAYNATTGVVTLATLTNQLPGAAGTVSNTITYTVPSGVAELTASANAAVTGATNDANLANNSAVAVATVSPATTSTTDEQTTVTSNVATQAAGSPVIFTVSSINNGPNAATNVVQTLTLPAGLTGVTVSNSGTYDVNTGIVTFPTVASQASGNTTPYTVTVNAPGAGPITAVASVSSATSDPTPANNLNSTSVAVTTLTDVAVTLAGPATVVGGQSATYAVSVINNGPSLATSTTTVQFPAGLTVVSVSGGGMYNSTTGVVTFPAITNQLSGANGLVTYSITAQAPAAIPNGASFNLVATLTPTAATNDQVAANNSASLLVSKGNLAPVANAVTNTLQGPEGNTANPLAISPLSGTDADGNLTTYTITSIPNATTQGVLALNGVAVKVGDPPLTPAQAAQLTFDPVATFVGNAFFTYTATDAAGAVSAPATYTIPVGQDLSAAYTAATTKGGSANKYVTNDVLAFVIDPNTAVYNNVGVIYNAAGAVQPTTGSLLTNNGVGTAVLAASGAGPAQNPTNALPPGVMLNPTTGQVYVSDASKLQNFSTAMTYYLNVVTTDLNGGTNTALAQFTIGAYPLPVELVAFTATAVGNRDAALAWATASEKNNDHFDVERSFDGTAASFVKIGQVASQGNKTSRTDYALTDANVAMKATGPVYYRLKQVDADGTVSYSPVQAVAFTKVTVAAEATLYPNPATTASGTTLDLSMLPTGTYQVNLVDATGRSVATYQLAGGQAHHLDLQYFASGTYVVLLSGTNLHQNLRLVKE